MHNFLSCFSNIEIGVRASRIEEREGTWVIYNASNLRWWSIHCFWAVVCPGCPPALWVLYWHAGERTGYRPSVTILHPKHSCTASILLGMVVRHRSHKFSQVRLQMRWNNTYRLPTWFQGTCRMDHVFQVKVRNHVEWIISLSGEGQESCRMNYN